MAVQIYEVFRTLQEYLTLLSCRVVALTDPSSVLSLVSLAARGECWERGKLSSSFPSPPAPAVRAMRRRLGTSQVAQKSF